jgi:general secretion pathway protein M
MNKVPTELPRCVTAFAVLFGLILILVTLVVLPWSDRNSLYDEEIERRNRQLQGYQRVIDTLPALEARLKSTRDNPQMDAFYIGATDPSLGGLSLQRLVEKQVSDSGGNLNSIQILPPLEEGDVTRISVRLRFLGPTEAFQKLIYAIESSKPVLFIDKLNVRAMKSRRSRRQRRDQAQQQDQSVDLHVNLDVYGYLRGGQG